MKVTLTAISGPHQGREFSFEEHSSFLAGRSKNAQFQLSQKDEYFSRFHFLVELNPPLCRIVDLQSRNGTFVNGQRVSTALLHEGDLIQTGRSVIRVAISGFASETLNEATPQLIASPQQSRAEVRPAHASTLTLVLPPAENLPNDFMLKIARREQPISGYSIINELGRGGMGVVYRAIREQDQSVVALKTVLPAARVTQKDLLKFRREALILSHLDHPNIVRFRDVGDSNGVIYLAMDYISGVDARELLRQCGKPLPVGRAVRIVCKVLDALEYAHERGYVHRDIKPPNVMIQHTEGKDLVWLTDFGLARTYQASRLSGLTLTGELGGTTKFMPREQILSFREAGPAVDQYSAAATLYMLLTNQHVYDYPDEFSAQLSMILTSVTVPLDKRRDDLPPGLVQAIQRALACEVGERFADVAGFRNAIERYTN